MILKLAVTTLALLSVAKAVDALPPDPKRGAVSQASALAETMMQQPRSERRVSKTLPKALRQRVREILAGEGP